MKKFYILVSIFSISAILVAFQNCAKNPTISRYDGTGNRVVKIENPLFIEKSVNNCLNGSSYTCRINRYAPDLKDDRIPSKVCVEILNEQVCTLFDDWSYDTSFALESCTDCNSDDGNPGGKYNSSEISCQFGDELPFESNEPDSKIDLELFFVNTIENCLSETNQ